MSRWINNAAKTSVRELALYVNDLTDNKVNPKISDLMCRAVVNTMKNKNGPRMLIVDDNEDVAESMGMTLEKWCSVVYVFNDPLETVAHFKPGQYDLVILDYLLPKMNGFELYKIIKQIDPCCKVCIMTASEIMASETNRKEFEQLNPPLTEGHILKKPFAQKQLFSKLWQILSGHNIETTERSEAAKIIDS